MGWLSILFVASIFIYTATLKWVAKDERVTLFWRHALWYALNDAFSWARALGLIERPKVDPPKQVLPAKPEAEKKPVKS